MFLFCGCIAWFVKGLVENIDDRFPSDNAVLRSGLQALKIYWKLIISPVYDSEKLESPQDTCTVFDCMTYSRNSNFQVFLWCFECI